MSNLRKIARCMLKRYNVSEGCLMIVGQDHVCEIPFMPVPGSLFEYYLTSDWRKYEPFLRYDNLRQLPGTLCYSDLIDCLQADEHVIMRQIVNQQLIETRKDLICVQLLNMDGSISVLFMLANSGMHASFILNEKSLLLEFVSHLYNNVRCDRELLIAHQIDMTHLTPSKLSLNPLINVKYYRKLTRSEKRIYVMLTHGVYRANDIADNLCLSRRTVEDYLDKIKCKLECNNKSELFNLALSDHVLSEV